jgi:ketosteroid isomerase-like protein
MDWQAMCLIYSPPTRSGRSSAMLPSRTYASRQEFLDVVIKPFNARLSKQLMPTVRGLYADGDMVIAFFDAEGTARDGKPYKNTYTWYLQMSDGRIVNVVAFFDTIEFTDFWTRITPEETIKEEKGG